MWADSRTTPYRFDIYGARVTPSGTVLDTAGIAISTTSGSEYYAGINFDGTNYFVVWQDERSGYVNGARMNPSGIVLDTAGIPLPNTFSDIAIGKSIAFGDTNYLLVGRDYRLGPPNIYGFRVSPSGIVLDTGINISTSANPQKWPSAAFDGLNYLAVWQDERNWQYSGYDIYGARVSPDGTIIDPSSIAISLAAGNQEFPTVAFDGTNYLVVWDNGDIYGARVNQFGTVLDPEGIAISTAVNRQLLPSVAFGRTDYFVVWEDYRLSYDYSDIYGARVNRDGIVLDPEGIPISTAQNSQYLPKIAFDGTNYLVVWTDYRSPAAVYGTRVTPQGIVLDTAGIQICTTGGFPSVAFDGTNYLVVWEDGRRSSYYSDIYGARISQAGIVLDTGIAICTTRYDQVHPSVTFDGSNYIVVWANYSDVPGHNYNTDIYGAAVSPSGSVIQSFSVATQPGEQWMSAITRGSENQVLITYSGWTGVYQGKNYNAYRIWGKFYPFVGIQEERITQNASRLMPEIYPNPARSYFTVRISPTANRIKIFDVSGKMIKEIATTASQSRNDKEVKIPLKGISPGIYFLRLGKETQKFLVVK